MLGPKLVTPASATKGVLGYNFLMCAVKCGFAITSHLRMAKEQCKVLRAFPGHPLCCGVTNSLVLRNSNPHLQFLLHPLLESVLNFTD